MSNIYTCVSQLIGNTPLLEMTGIQKDLRLKARLLPDTGDRNLSTPMFQM